MKKAEEQEIIHYIAELIIRGATNKDIERKIQNDKPEIWKKIRRTFPSFLKDARNMIEDMDETDASRDFHFQLSVRRLNMLYARSFSINDFKTCVTIVKEYIRLYGLTDKVKLPEPDTPDPFAKILADLSASMPSLDGE